MHYSIENNLLLGARQRHSPNQSDRTSAEAIDLLIIHNISLPPGEFGTACVDALFSNTLDTSQHPYFETIAGLQVSSHLFVQRDGTVSQYVPFDKKAWHAGESQFAGRTNCNDFSIGIELEGTDFEPFTDAQYEALVAVTLLLMQRYPGLISDRIVGHSEVAPGRKTDPGPCFDWHRYKSSLNGAMLPEPKKD
jgi:AmpD protein